VIEAVGDGKSTILQRSGRGLHPVSMQTLADWPLWHVGQGGNGPDGAKLETLGNGQRLRQAARMPPMGKGDWLAILLRRGPLDQSEDFGPSLFGKTGPYLRHGQQAGVDCLLFFCGIAANCAGFRAACWRNLLFFRGLRGVFESSRCYLNPHNNLRATTPRKRVAIRILSDPRFSSKNAGLPAVRLGAPNRQEVVR
jgi:hypothetical protein